MAHFPIRFLASKSIILALAMGALGGVLASCGGTPPPEATSTREVDDPSCTGKMPNDPCDLDNNLCTIERCMGTPGSLVCTSTGTTAILGTACNSDGDQCTIDHCDAMGACLHDFALGQICDDGTVCTTGDTCVGTPLAHSCVGAPVMDGTPCPPDTSSCTIDQCTGGVCEHRPDATLCGDSNPCTVDICDPADPLHDPTTGCVHPAASPTTPCDSDGVPCTMDLCSGTDGTCLHTPNDLLCDDTFSCTMDHCDAVMDCQHTPMDSACDDQNVCNGMETCDPSSGMAAPVTGCVAGGNLGAGAPCTTDNVGCTVDACNGTGQCLHTPDDSACDDSTSCTDDTCTGAGCINTPVDSRCSDGNVCTSDFCNPLLSTMPGTGCYFPALPPGTACTSDAVACTTDACDGSGVCQHMPNNAACDDANACTIDTCDPALDCQHPSAPTSTTCDDGDMCTTGDHCNGSGTCTSSGMLRCDDGNPCTDDSCSSSLGCQTAPSPASRACDDQDMCTTGDHCSGGGLCVGGAARSCDDGNSCTTDACAPLVGCTNTAIPACCRTDGDCADSDVCTTNEHCDTGTGLCSSTRVANCCHVDGDCNDSNVCSTDTCSSANRCEHGPVLGCCTNDSQCADATICTADACDLGAHRCTHTAVAGCCNSAADCDDGNLCTNQVCLSGTQTCGFTPVQNCCLLASDCDDQNPCTDDSCDGTMQCQHTTLTGCCLLPTDCDDGLTCTTDACNLLTNQCTHVGVLGCCGNDTDCTSSDMCHPGTCNLTTNTCQITTQAGCCTTDADCDDGNVCTQDHCNTAAHTCTNTPRTTGGCCATGTDCDDHDVCTADQCDTALHACRHTGMSSCCHGDFECVDADTCTVDHCAATHTCSHTPSPACIADGGAPDAAAQDGSPVDGSGIGGILHGSGGCSASGSSSASGSRSVLGLLAAVLLALLTLRRGHRRTRVRQTLLLVVALGSVAMAAATRARADGLRPVDTELFHPAAGWDHYLSQQGAAPPGHLLLTAGAYMTYAHAPLVQTVSGVDMPVINSQIGIDVVGSVALWNRLLLSLDVPFAAHRDVGGTLDSSAVGDLRVGLKGVLGELPTGSSRLGAALAVGIDLPTGDKDNFAGSGTVSVEPRAIFDLRHKGFGISVSGGVVLRQRQKVASLDVGNQGVFGAGVRVPLYRDFVSALGEIYGWVPIDSSSMQDVTPVEALGGLRFWLGDMFELTAAGGRGMTSGYGTTDGRFVAGLGIVPHPSEPAPPPPVELEPVPLPPPPPVDSDGDGLLDPDDQCPHEAGPKENHGCPDKDKDGDGLIDRLDKCPEEAGPKENDGCPDKDTDGDGIVDRLDKCPTEPETFNGFEDEDGCPDKGPVLAVLTDKKIEIKQPVFFRTAKSLIDKRSFPLLGTVATLLKLHPEIKKLRIEGHTDSRGAQAYNLRLSQERANSVMNHLVSVHGIDPVRLEAEGFGPARPIAPNMTRGGRAMNRRVEFVITDKGETQPAAPAAPMAPQGGPQGNSGMPAPGTQAPPVPPPK